MNDPVRYQPNSLKELNALERLIEVPHNTEPH